VIKRCLADKVGDVHVTTRKDGRRVTYAMLKKLLKALVIKCKEEDANFRAFTVHDLKRKSITDQKIEQNSAGHKSRQMQLRYRVRPERVKPPK
jgi:hypothetical protein